MRVDTVKALAVYVTASILTIGAPVLMLFAWLQPPVDGRDLAILFGLLGGAFGAASTFLFGQETATRASHATERAVAITAPPTPTPLDDAADVAPGANVGLADAG